MFEVLMLFATNIPSFYTKQILAGVNRIEHFASNDECCQNFVSCLASHSFSAFISMILRHLLYLIGDCLFVTIYYDDFRNTSLVHGHGV